MTITTTFILGSASGALITHALLADLQQQDVVKIPLPAPDLPADSTAHCAMRALIVASEPEMISTLSQVFREKRILAQECICDAAIEQLSSDKFAALVLDLDHVPRSADLLQRLPGANKRVLVIAVASDDASKAIASRLGVSFIIERPVQPERLRNLVASAYGRMLRDNQVYFRLAIELPVSIRKPDGKLLKCTSLNVSQTGMAVNTPEAFAVGERIHIAFAIPNTDIFVSAEGKVIWDDKHGKAGISFECTSSSVHGSFGEWLHDHFHMNLEAASHSQTNWQAAYVG
jgi:DNA-binding response OmpR family regulator